MIMQAFNSTFLSPYSIVIRKPKTQTYHSCVIYFDDRDTNLETDCEKFSYSYI